MSKIKLRKWQEEAGLSAYKAFSTGQEAWVTEACTGSGKTLHGVDVAGRLARADMVDLVVVVTPSVATRRGWIRALNLGGFSATDNPDLFPTGDFDALVIGYGGRSKLESALYSRPVYKGFFLIVDEYHHAEEDASWGQSVTVLNNSAACSMFLSGTPWRSTGQIAVLASHKNCQGQPYYNGDRVMADFKYQYRDDLNQSDDADRGTVTVEFDFQDSQYTDPSTGQVEELTNPHLSKMPEAEREQWITKALASEQRIGRHVRTQAGGVDYRLSKNRLVRDLLETGVSRLAKHRVRARSQVPVLLVVAQSIKEARAVYEYMVNVKGQRASLIVSDRDEASDEIANAQDKAQGGLLDVIVSVGMISEGVDIPQIKGIVFLSGIMTTLYIIQVLGRLLRRIRVGGEYMDHSVNHLPGFFIAPSAPRLVAIAYRVEQEIGEARRRSQSVDGSVDPDNEEPTEPVEPAPVGIVSTNGDREHVYRGSEDHADWQRAIDIMMSHDRADACHVDRFWAEWILSMVLSGNKDAWDEARRQAEDRCDCLGISLGELLNRAVEVAEVTLSMEQQHKLASREAVALRNRLRWGVRPFMEIEDSGKAYIEVNKRVGRRCGFSGKFPAAGIEDKRRWIRAAEEILREEGAL